MGVDHYKAPLSLDVITLREAVLDALWMLERGYRRETVRDIIGDKYNMDKRLRSLIYRCVHPLDWISNVKEKTVEPSKLRGKCLAVDFLNVLGTVLSAMSGGILVKSLDGFIRDLSELHTSILKQPDAYEATSSILKKTASLAPSVALFLLEANVSYSGEFSEFIREELERLSVNGTALTCRSVDSELIKTGYIVATSDAPVMARVDRIVDLAKVSIQNIKTANYYLIDLQKLIWTDLW
ncbi:MAG: DUF434 domain-containing protein [Nitrososphaerota archaeon]